MSGLARNLVSVGGFTLLSRITGFVRDIVLGAMLGAGALADAFYIALRLPNHFRAIFGEGAFNAAYVPAYSRVLEQQGGAPAKDFSARIFAWLAWSQILLLALALIFTRTLLEWLAPGFSDDPEKMAQAITMTRIVFPYLLCVTLVTLIAGTLNANGRFAAAAFAPVLLNLAIVALLALAWIFPGSLFTHAGIAASTGVLVAGVLELALVIWVARRAGLFALSLRPGLGEDVRKFFKAFGPAVIGAGGVQIAMFADTIIGSMLPDGGVSSIYYADRLYQLPIGVIGIAAGTVLLPEMSRRFAAGDQAGALAAQNRTMGLTLLLAAPFFVAFVLISDIIMRGVFLRGAFTEEAVRASAQVLTAYGSALFAMVLIRSAVASFQARGDTKTPMYISLAAVAVNLVLKVVLFQPLGAPGLALATAAGAWINLIALVVLAHRRGDMGFDRLLKRTVLAVAVASGVLALFAFFASAPARTLGASLTRFVNEAHLLVLAGGGAVVYLAVLAAMLLALRISPRALLAARRPAKHAAPPAATDVSPPSA